MGKPRRVEFDRRTSFAKAALRAYVDSDPARSRLRAEAGILRREWQHRQAELQDIAAGWAKPILDAKFGEREDWLFANPDEDRSQIDVLFTDRLHEHVLTVHRSGRVTGTFKREPQLRFAETERSPAGWDANIEIRDLAHLGLLLERHHQCWEFETEFGDGYPADPP